MKPSVLVVDDEPGLPELIAEILEREGFSCVIARSLQEAKRHPGPFDVVVADVRLPNGDGRHLREDFADVPFVVVTGWTEKSIVESEPYFLPKPFTPLQLKEKVWEAAKKAKGGA